MAIEGGALSPNQEQVGIDVIWSPFTGGGWITVNYYVRSLWSISDNQTLTLSGSITGAYSYYLTASAWLHVASRSFSVNTVPGGGPTYTFTAQVSGHYAGDTPHHTRYFTVPSTPATVPGQVAKPWLAAVATVTARFGWSIPASNGSPILDYHVQVADNPTFTSPVVSQTGVTTSSTIFGGLTPNTAYRMRVRARNAFGYGAWSVSSDAFATLAAAPGQVTSLAATPSGPYAVDLTWAAPSSGGSAITGYDISYSTGGGSATVLSRGTPLSGTVTDLVPGTGYQFRVRARNAIGAGTWSAEASAVTLGGVRLGQGGAFRSARFRVGDTVTGTLAPVRPYLGTDGSFT